MQIHELNNFTGTLGSGAYLAVDDGNDTGKLSTQQLLSATEARIDNIIAGPAPSAEEIVDARLGADGVTYPSLGDAIRDQVSDLKADRDALYDSEFRYSQGTTSGYVDAAGNVSPSSSYKYSQIDLAGMINPVLHFTANDNSGVDFATGHTLGGAYKPSGKNAGEHTLSLAGCDYVYLNFFGSRWVGEYFISVDNPVEIKEAIEKDIDDAVDALSAKVGQTEYELVLDKEMITIWGHFMNSNGTTGTALSHNVVRIPYTDVTRITVPPIPDFSGDVATVVVMNDSTPVGYLMASTEEETFLDMNTEYTDLYVNWWNSNNTAWFDSVTLKYKQLEAIEEISDEISTLSAQTNNGTKAVDITSMEMYGNGYFEVNQDYTISITPAASHQCYRMPSDGISYVEINLETGLAMNLISLAVTNSGGTVVAFKGTHNAGKYVMELTPVSGGYLYVNLWGKNTVPNPYYSQVLLKPYVLITDAYRTEIEEMINDNISYASLVRKPFSFNGKSITFAGDSITVGHTTGTTTTPNNYPKLFCDLVGATANNIAVAGATLSVVSGYNSIQTQLQNADKTKDILFIAGGINDWQLGVDLDDFKDAVETICDYINANYPNNTPVIWITPINQAGWELTHSLDLVGTVDDYRRIITRVVMEKDTYARFSVIQGKLFNFPTKYDDAEYITAMFGDRLHPSELGYKTLYLTGLQTALL